MNSKIVFKFWLGLLFLALSGANCALAADGYPVVLTGPAALRGWQISRLEAFSRHGSVWQRIPMQIDEVNVRGDFVLSDGMPFTKDSDDGLFDDNDELVLWGGDLGDDFKAEDIPLHLRQQAGGGKWWKLQLRRQKRPIGAVLIIGLNAQNPPPLSGSPHVVFSQSGGQGLIASSLYEYHFAKDNPALLGEVLLVKDGKKLPVIKDSRFVMPLVTPWYLPNMSFDSSDFTSSIESWQVGPLRTIVAVGVKYTSFLSLFKLHLFSELVFYRNKFEIPTVIEFVFDPTSHLKPGSGIAYSLSFPEGHAWQIDSNLKELPPMPPSEVVAKGMTAEGTDVFYARGSNDSGAFYVQVRVDEAARRSVPPPFLFGSEAFKDPTLKKSWPWLSRLQGDLGVYLDFAGVRKGTYDFGLDLLLSSKAHESFTDYGFVDATWQNGMPLN